MVTIVQYNKYNTQFESVEMQVGTTPNQTSIILEIIEEDNGSGVMVKKLVVKSKDELGAEISSKLTKEESMQLLTALQNTIRQL